MDALLLHRIHFGFTITYHYLFPQLTMGFALLIVALKTIALRRNDSRYQEAARFWGKVFAVNFLIGVVTGIPMEFQFGTNWSQFSRWSGWVRFMFWKTASRNTDVSSCASASWPD